MHYDLYRLEATKELDQLGIFENSKNTITVVEWPEKVKKNQLLTEDELTDNQNKFGEDAFTAAIGAEAILEILKSLDLKEERKKLSEQDRKSVV